MASSRSQQSKRSADAAGRIGPLAVLPVFFNLQGKSVLVIGGGEPAAWKAELLAQAGAKVLVVAGCVGEAMAALAKRTDLRASLAIETREWSERDFAAMALVVADADTDEEACAIFDFATRSGVPVNVIDKSSCCTFQFGSIVNRSPVVIGISTSGAAPVLGQSIRTRIECLLPETLAQWAAHARDIRAMVSRRFKPGIERRRFWANFAGKAFGPFRPECVWHHCEVNAGRGTISTIRVNPLDPEELTLKSIRILQAADVIYFESSVAGSVINHARREARRLSVANWTGAVSGFRFSAELDDLIRQGRQVVLVEADMPDRNVSTNAGDQPVANGDAAPIHNQLATGALPC